VVQNSLAVRLAHVPPAAIALASAAAILSDGTPLRQVAALAELDAEVAEQAADVLSAANILAQGEPITFIHPLIAAAVQAGMTPFARARAHRRAASLLAREGSSSQQVATHLLAARPDGDQWVVGQLREAAGVALRRGAPKTAIRLLSRALAEPPLSDTRTEVLIELAQAKAADGSAEAIDHLTVAVETLQDPRRRAQVYQDLSRLLLTQGNLSGAAEVARRAINELPAADPLVRGLLADYLSAAVLYGPLRADAVSRLQPIIRSAALGQLPEESTLSALAAVQAACTCEPSGLVRSLVDAALVNDPLVDGKSHGGVGLSAVAVALLKVDELELAEQVLDRAIEVSQRHGRMIALGFASTWRSHVHYHRGRLVDAVTDAERALDLAQDGWKWYVSRAAPALIQAHIERGDLNSARAVLQRKDRASSENLTHALLFEARGHLALMEDDPAAALEEFQAAQSHLERFQVFHPGYCGWQRGAAIANARLGRDQEATALAESALALARRLGIPRPLGQALYTAGLVTSGQSAVELLSEAVAVLEHSAAALHLAHALVELGAALRRSGNRVAAREPLRRGLELAQLFTALPLV
ncbi:MAG: hypothetical protein ACREP9_11935, partial [Candidatus Dormibacteraceae bacterium]